MPVERLLTRPDLDRLLADLRGRPVNFQPGPPERFSPRNGWHRDELCQALTPEEPGAPQPDGSFAVARRLMRDYRMADPAIVRATFDRQSPLDGRDMLLELRFWGLRFYVGVRVGEVWDEVRSQNGADVAVWGFEYSTLQGHVERGRMDYEVRKRLDTGEVEFHIRAFSQAAEEGKHWVRLGFRLFGRREQLRFYRRCCERMARLVAVELAHRPEHEPVEPPEEGIAEAHRPETGTLVERLTGRTAGPR